MPARYGAGQAHYRSRAAPRLWNPGAAGGNGQELKVWQAVPEYATAQPKDSSGNPHISNYYAKTSGRLIQHSIFLPLWKGLVLGLMLLAVLLVIGVYKFRQQKLVQKIPVVDTDKCQW